MELPLSFGRRGPHLEVAMAGSLFDRTILLRLPGVRVPAS